VSVAGGGHRPNRYTCPRCGIVKTVPSARQRPAVCGDCRLVVRDLKEAARWR